MSKKVIRLTESELKRMIKSIISEQSVTPGVAAAPAQGIKKELLGGLNGKNADIFADAAKTNLLGRYRIMGVGTSMGADKDPGLYLQVKNLSEISNTGNPNGRQPDPKGIKAISISCDVPYLYADFNGGGGARVHCAQLEAKLKEAMNCQNINRNADFAQAGDKSQTDFA